MIEFRDLGTCRVPGPVPDMGTQVVSRLGDRVHDGFWRAHTRGRGGFQDSVGWDGACPIGGPVGRRHLSAELDVAGSQPPGKSWAGPQPRPRPWDRTLPGVLGEQLRGPCSWSRVSEGVRGGGRWCRDHPRLYPKGGAVGRGGTGPDSGAHRRPLLAALGRTGSGGRGRELRHQANKNGGWARLGQE